MVRLSYAKVVSTLAVFVALGGSAYAGMTVTGRSVANDSLTGRDMRSLAGRDVRARAIGGRHLETGSVEARHLRFGPAPSVPGPAGGAGPAGARGATGPAGATGGLAGVTVRSSGGGWFTSSDSPEADVVCGPGERATGGGFELSDPDAEVVVSEPVTMLFSEFRHGWRVRAERPAADADPWTLKVWVVCASG